MEYNDEGSANFQISRLPEKPLRLMRDSPFSPRLDLDNRLADDCLIQKPARTHLEILLQPLQ